MNKVIVQVPVTKQLRDSAEQAAMDQGFSSLQEVVRVFMKKFSDRSIGITLEQAMPLSAVSEKRYRSIDRDVKQNKNIQRANDVHQLMQQLHGTGLS